MKSEAENQKNQLKLCQGRENYKFSAAVMKFDMTLIEHLSREARLLRNFWVN